MADRLPYYVTGHHLQQRPPLPAHNNTETSSSYMIPRQIQMVPPMPGMYCVTQPNVNLYVTPLTSIPHQTDQLGKRQEGQQCTNEEMQRLKGKLMKERNFQLQQQRLREFQPSSRPMQQRQDHHHHHHQHQHQHQHQHHQPPASVDLLIENVFDQMASKSTANRSAGPKVIDSADQRPRLGTGVSQKPRDWSELGDLRDVFHAPSYSGLPPWCQDGALVPPIYSEVVDYVTRNGIIDASLLYPILLSSGLSRETLGHIWSLATHHQSGQLSRSGIYSILAMVALAQRACQITSLSILNGIQQAPVPLLNQTMRPNIQQTDSAMALPVGVGSGSHNFSAQEGTTTNLQMPASPMMAAPENVGFTDTSLTLANYNVQSSLRTDFDVNGADEFSDFQRAIKDDPKTATIRNPPDDNLMSVNDDKYSVFRVLEQTLSSDKDEDEFGDFLSSSAADSSTLKPSIHAASQPEPPAPPVSSWKSEESCCAANHQQRHSKNSVNFSAACDTDDDDFGEFMGSDDQKRQMCDATETKFQGSLDSLNSLYLKANDPSCGSIENQSVSSFELGTNLSRCGSVKSLDLKVTSENGVVSKDATPLADIHSALNGFKKQEGPLTVDRYSIIRSEVEAESANLGECRWQRCLQSCKDLLRNVVNILKNLQQEKHLYAEVIESEDGHSYLKNVTEIYKISRRIATAIHGYTNASLTSKLDDIVQAIESDWDTFSSLTSSPSDRTTTLFDFASLVLEPNDDVMSACGVCLLGLTGVGQSCSSDHIEADPKLTYGGRQYHASCANFWVNCVDSLLPALTFYDLKQTTFR